uniref:Nectin cell adhesion molecule 1b n=1 Tax=Cyprinus carpio TaxID=7962 RepID=A0A8C2F9R2_CYPCA
MTAGNGQSVQTDPSKSGFVGDTVELRCVFINGKPPVKISQVTWQKLINGTKQNVATANPDLGVSVLPPFKDRVSFKHPAVRQRTSTQSAPSTLEDTTIVFSNLRLSDEAAYICEYTTFPAGNRENMVNLTVFARPVTQMTLTSATIVARTPKRKIPVATCMSANGKPPSIIKWDTTLKGEATFQETRNPNGTVTVRSNYIVLPSRETHRQKLTCIVTYHTDRFIDSVILNVQYEPEVKIEGFDGNWYLNRQDVKLTCNADANPAVTIYQWKLALTHSPLPSVFSYPEFPNSSPFDGREIPQEVHSYGAAIGGAVGGVALLVAAIALLVFFLRRRQRTFKGDYSTKKHVFGNGYSKAGGMAAHPPMPKNLQYPDDSDDEKKPAQISGPGGFESGDQDFDGNSEDLKRPYFTVDEGESRDYDERTLAFQYDPEPEITDDMVSQTDGSVISKKEWYV